MPDNAPGGRRRLLDLWRRCSLQAPETKIRLPWNEISHPLRTRHAMAVRTHFNALAATALRESPEANWPHAWIWLMADARTFFSGTTIVSPG